MVFRLKHQELREQRSMCDEPVISFDVSRVIKVIMNAMPVKGQGGIAKKLCCAKGRLLPVGFIRFCHLREW